MVVAEGWDSERVRRAGFMSGRGGGRSNGCTKGGRAKGESGEEGEVRKDANVDEEGGTEGEEE